MIRSGSLRRRKPWRSMTVCWRSAATIRQSGFSRRIRAASSLGRSQRAILSPGFSPDPRFVLKAEDLHIPKSLEKVLRKGAFTYTVDKAFPEVIHACASVPRPGQDGTWITEVLEKGYCELQRRGFAHSFETWLGGELVGGFYGVSIGRCFFGESMFAHAPDASKCAFATFARQMFAAGTPWIDCQVYTDHLARFGAKEIPRSAYLDLLAREMARMAEVEERG